jgi:hypothetical protein
MTTLSLLDRPPAPPMTPWERMNAENVARCRKKDPLCYQHHMVTHIERGQIREKRNRKEQTEAHAAHISYLLKNPS